MVAAVTTRANGFAEMAYVGEVPWHKQGQQLQRGAPIEEWVKSAGMDWKIARSRARFSANGQMAEFPGKVVLFRDDTLAPLGMVSDMYKPVQPKETLEFFRDLVGANGYELETAGTLFDGKKFWSLANIGEDAVITGNDKIRGYLLLSTSADGSLATTARVTTVRVVCNNTLTAAVAGGNKGAHTVAISHRTEFNAEAVKNQLGLARGTFREFIIQARALSNRPIHDVAAGEFVGELLMETKTVGSDSVAGAQETKPFKAIMDLFRGLGKGSDLDGSKGTLWGVVNGVTEYVDHHARARSAGNRLDNAWFGRGDTLKTAAVEKALALV